MFFYVLIINLIDLRTHNCQIFYVVSRLDFESIEKEEVNKRLSVIDYFLTTCFHNNMTLHRIMRLCCSRISVRCFRYQFRLEMHQTIVSSCCTIHPGISVSILNIRDDIAKLESALNLVLRFGIRRKQVPCLLEYKTLILLPRRTTSIILPAIIELDFIPILTQVGGNILLLLPVFRDVYAQICVQESRDITPRSRKGFNY